MNLNEPDAKNAAAFASPQSSGEPQPETSEAQEEAQKLDQLDEKLKAILERARQGEAAAIAKLRQVEEALLDKAL